MQFLPSIVDDSDQYKNNNIDFLLDEIQSEQIMLVW
jgi:hypothetical protein